MKKILLGISGSISIYKTCSLIRELTKLQIPVTVVMTKNSEKFICKTTFEAITEQKVYTDQFEDGMTHIKLRENTNLFAIVPASANIIGKCANGIADDLLTSTYLSANFPILIAPAMNPYMFEKKAVQRNIERLKNDGVVIIEPQKGETLCGDVGFGKLAETEEIKKAILEIYDKV